MLIIVASACSLSASIDQTPTQSLPDSPTIELSPAVTETPAPTVAPTEAIAPTQEAPDTFHLSYDITAWLDYGQKTVEIEQSIAITLLPADIRTLVMVVEPNRYPNGMAINSIDVGQLRIEDYSLAGNQLQFDLPERPQSSDPLQIQLNYTLHLPAIPPPSEMYKPQPYGYTDRQLNLVDWYAFIPPFDEQNEWIVHKPPIFGESLVYPASDFTVDLEITGNNVPLTVAASSAAVRSENRYQFFLPDARTFAISMSPEYVVQETHSAGVTVKAYAFQNSRIPNQAVVGYAAQAVSLYSELFGPLPNREVSIVQADFLDGMEYDGLYFVSKGFYNLYDGSVNGYLSLITVHEMAHQWWFGVVGSDQALEPWLDEGLATFAELQYIERYYPDQVDWWWFYRVNIYEPEGYIDQSIYDYPSYIAYRNSVYLRSAQFLYELRGQVGVKGFNDALRRYREKENRQVSGADAFWSVFENLPGYPFSELRAGYFKNLP